MWLSIQDYSYFHKISISTIRRMIKSKKLKVKLENGKYLIYDESENLTNIKNKETINTVKDTSNLTLCPMLDDLNKANSKINELLKEKERLQEQIEELKMLIKILEEKSGIKVSV